jgi:hypothetical protein
MRIEREAIVEARKASRALFTEVRTDSSLNWMVVSLTLSLYPAFEMFSVFSEDIVDYLLGTLFTVVADTGAEVR